MATGSINLVALLISCEGSKEASSGKKNAPSGVAGPELTVSAAAVYDTQNLEFGGIRCELVFARDYDIVKENFVTDS